MVGKLIFLLVVAAGSANAQATAEEEGEDHHRRCINSMFRAARRFYETEQKINEMRWNEQLDAEETCEAYQLLYDVVFDTVAADGCSWGQPPQEFESRLKLLQPH